MFTPESYSIIISLFPRLLGLIFFFAFGAFLFQIKGLIGSNGILPVGDHLKWLKDRFPKKHYRIAPTLFWFNSSDTALMSVVAAGTCLSVLLMFGLYPSLILFLLYFLYLSIIVSGQDFLCFGWEAFLLEITVNTFFLSLTPEPNFMVWVSLNFLLFRFHLQAGAVKLQSRDPSWRNLTALDYHYVSQPIPNLIAWYVQKFPSWFHKASTLLMFVVELAVPFAIFGPDWMRLWAFFALVGLQVMIWVTGNLSYLNHLTAAFCTILIANVYLTPWFEVPMVEPTSWFLSMLCTGAGTTLLILQVVNLWQHFVPNPLFGMILQLFNRYHIANRYGLFAIMTTSRHEIIFEGSNDGVNWKEYTFRYKPSEITRRPRRISPYQPRIDWQAWFLPLGNYRYELWFGNFIYRLLQGSPEVLALLRHNPFPDAPPLFVRTTRYEYEFSSAKEKKEHGWWWRRRYLGVFTEPVSLKP
ncbi:MAG: lipase maturation factor family protein [Parachlamydiaceae bacterium]